MNKKTECSAPAPANQKELVRLLYLEHGHQKAAQLSGVNYDLVRQWAHRGKWSKPMSQAVTTTKLIADNVQSEIERLEHETRSSLARSSARMAKDAEQATLRDSDKVHNVAKTAAIVHRWDAKEQSEQNVIVNVALLGIQPSEVQSPTIDVYADVSE